MRSRSNHAPTTRTILLAVVLVIVGVLGTFLNYLPDRVGVIAFIVAGVLLLLGIVARGL
jgi:uncharacterized membrane protein